MRVFETRYGAGVGLEEIRIQPYREALWAAAFGVADLGMLFDIETPERAIQKIDDAIRRFNHEPNSLRPLLAEEDRAGLIGNRRVLEQMRATLADHPDATISGAVEAADVPPTP